MATEITHLHGKADDIDPPLLPSAKPPVKMAQLETETVELDYWKYQGTTLTVTLAGDNLIVNEPGRDQDQIEFVVNADYLAQVLAMLHPDALMRAAHTIDEHGFLSQ